MNSRASANGKCQGRSFIEQVNNSGPIITGRVIRYVISLGVRVPVRVAGTVREGLAAGANAVLRRDKRGPQQYFPHGTYCGIFSFVIS